MINDDTTYWTRTRNGYTAEVWLVTHVTDTNDAWVDVHWSVSRPEDDDGYEPAAGVLAALQTEARSLGQRTALAIRLAQLVLAELAE